MVARSYPTESGDTSKSVLVGYEVLPKGFAGRQTTRPEQAPYVATRNRLGSFIGCSGGFISAAGCCQCATRCRRRQRVRSLPAQADRAIASAGRLNASTVFSAV